jgi:Tol biopolymer transport system component
MNSTGKKFLILVMLITGSSLVTAQTGPYFNQPDPGLTPKRFAPAKIPLGSFAITFSPDGMECFLTRNTDTINSIWRSKVENGAWINVEKASFSGFYPDAEPHITPDGTKMYFGSARPLPGSTEEKNRTWLIEKLDTGWTEPQPMDPPLRDIFMMYTSVTGNGNMYFSATDSNWNQWIAVSRYVNGVYQEPERISDSINYLLHPAHPFVSPDESYIIVDAVTDTTNWARNLYISFHRPDGSWTKAVDMGPVINTVLYNMFPFVSRDGKYFFFGRNNLLMWVNESIIEQMRPRSGD